MFGTEKCVLFIEVSSCQGVYIHIMCTVNRKGLTDFEACKLTENASCFCKRAIHSISLYRVSHRGGGESTLGLPPQVPRWGEHLGIATPGSQRGGGGGGGGGAPWDCHPRFPEGEHLVIATPGSQRRGGSTPGLPPQVPRGGGGGGGEHPGIATPGFQRGGSTLGLPPQVPIPHTTLQFAFKQFSVLPGQHPLQ